MEVPPSRSSEFVHDREKAQAVVASAVAEGRSMLSEPEAKTVLAAYGIPVVDTRIARTIEEAVKVASEIGFPLALKILSPDISHKSDVGGVALNLENARALGEAAKAMLRRLHEYQPNARLQGFTVQSMARRPNAQELIVGTTTDAVFGPVILFGQGGTPSRGHRRPRGRPATAQHGACAGAHVAHADRQAARWVPRSPTCGHRRDWPDADSGIAFDRRHPADRRARHQPSSGRRPRASSPSTRACASRARIRAGWIGSRYGPIPRNSRSG